MTQLYKLSEEMTHVKALLDEGVPPEAVADTLEGMALEFNDKAEKMLYLINNIKSDESQIDAEIERLKENKRLIANKQNQLIEYLRENMEKSGIDKIECPLFKITLRKASQIVVIDNIDDLSDEFVKVETTVSADKNAIKAAIKEGREVLGAHIDYGKRGLMIK